MGQIVNKTEMELLRTVKTQNITKHLSFRSRRINQTTLNKFKKY